MQADNAMAIKAKNISFAYEKHEQYETMENMAINNIERKTK